MPIKPTAASSKQASPAQRDAIEIALRRFEHTPKNNLGEVLSAFDTFASAPAVQAVPSVAEVLKPVATLLSMLPQLPQLANERVPALTASADIEAEGCTLSVSGRLIQLSSNGRFTLAHAAGPHPPADGGLNLDRALTANILAQWQQPAVLAKLSANKKFRKAVGPILHDLLFLRGVAKQLTGHAPPQTLALWNALIAYQAPGAHFARYPCQCGGRCQPKSMFVDAMHGSDADALHGLLQSTMDQLRVTGPTEPLDADVLSELAASAIDIGDAVASGVWNIEQAHAIAAMIHEIFRLQAARHAPELCHTASALFASRLFEKRLPFLLDTIIAHLAAHPSAHSQGPLFTLGKTLIAGKDMARLSSFCRTFNVAHAREYFAQAPHRGAAAGPTVLHLLAQTSHLNENETLELLELARANLPDCAPLAMIAPEDVAQMPSRWMPPYVHALWSQRPRVAHFLHQMQQAYGQRPNETFRQALAWVVRTCAAAAAQAVSSGPAIFCDNITLIVRHVTFLERDHGLLDNVDAQMAAQLASVTQDLLQLHTFLHEAASKFANMEKNKESPNWQVAVARTEKKNKALCQSIFRSAPTAGKDYDNIASALLHKLAAAADAAAKRPEAPPANLPMLLCQPQEAKLQDPLRYFVEQKATEAAELYLQQVVLPLQIFAQACAWAAKAEQSTDDPQRINQGLMLRELLQTQVKTAQHLFIQLHALLQQGNEAGLIAACKKAKAGGLCLTAISSEDNGALLRLAAQSSVKTFDRTLRSIAGAAPRARAFAAQDALGNSLYHVAVMGAGAHLTALSQETAFSPEDFFGLQNAAGRTAADLAGDGGARAWPAIWRRRPAVAPVAEAALAATSTLPAAIAELLGANSIEQIEVGLARLHQIRRDGNDPQDASWQEACNTIVNTIESRYPGKFFGAHFVDHGSDVTDEALHKRGISQRKAGSSRFGKSDAPGILWVRQEALSRLRDKLVADGNKTTGSFSILLRHNGLCGEGFRRARSDSATMRWFGASLWAVVVLSIKEKGAEPWVVSMYPEWPNDREVEQKGQLICLPDRKVDGDRHGGGV